MDEDLERVITDRLAADDTSAAATAAVSGLGPQILGYIAAMLRDDDAAYDVFGQFSEELWKSIGTFRGDSSFKTWAYKLVMHALARYYRDGYRKRAVPLGSEVSGLAEEVRSSTPPYKRSEIKDRFAQLREALEPEEQTLLFLRVDQKLPWQDVAAIIAEQGEPVEVATLRKRFERAKLRLRELAAAEGLLPEP